MFCPLHPAWGSTCRSLQRWRKKPWQPDLLALDKGRKQNRAASWCGHRELTHLPQNLFLGKCQAAKQRLAREEGKKLA